MNLKKCGSCGERKDTQEFYEDKRYKYGRAWQCKDCIRKNYARNKVKIIDRNKNRRIKNLTAWLSYLLENPRCEICGKTLEYFSKNPKNSVHFDHRISKAEIKGEPYAWLRGHFPTPENISVWERSKFGILCNRCNRWLPTEDRPRFAQNLLSYIERGSWRVKKSYRILKKETEDKGIEKRLDWKVYFNINSGLPCGSGFSVVVAAPDENLPPYVNKPHWVEEREAVLYILKKKK